MYCLIEMVWVIEIEATQKGGTNAFKSQMFLLDIDEVTLTSNGYFCLRLSCFSHLFPESKKEKKMLTLSQ